MLDGTEKTFILSKFPAIAGREIIAKYPVSAMPKIGDYSVNEEIMLKLMSYVAIYNNDTVLPLTGRALIDNHCKDWETLAKLEMAMMEYNTSFFLKGRIYDFFQDFAQNTTAKIIEALTVSSAQ